MGTRRKARETAMQALFFMDERRDFSDEMFDRFCANFAPKPDVHPYFLRLVQGVLKYRAELDALIHPGAAERCNAADDDCNGSTDETFACAIGANRSCTTSCSWRARLAMGWKWASATTQCSFRMG